MTSRPNILFFQVDQLTAGALSAYGGPAITPNLDALAGAGAVFETAYCNYPLCSPSRASMATGKLASKVAAYDNAAELSAEIPTYAHHLRAAGYQTALSGKMHFIGPDQHHGFEKRLTAELYPADFAWVPNWEYEGKRDTNDARAVTISGVCKRSIQIDYDDEVTEAAIAHLGDIAASDDERPFFLQVSYTHPHEPYLCQQRFWDLYENADLPMPRTPMLSEAEHDPHSVRILKDFGMLVPSYSEDDIRRAIRGYYGAISYVDSLIARVMDTLRSTGLDRNTMIVFTSDHGEMLGERGIWFKKCFFEPSMRVPLFISGPGISPTRVRTFASLVDLLPTFVAMAHAEEPSEPLDGENLLPLIGAEEQERAVYGEYLAEATPAPIFMIRRGRYKYVASRADGEMLYDLEEDPEERANLASDAAHAGVLATFAQEAAQIWDELALTQDILQSQRRRLLVKDAMGQGARRLWNHDEQPGDQTRWYRGEQGYNEWAFDHE